MPGNLGKLPTGGQSGRQHRPLPLWLQETGEALDGPMKGKILPSLQDPNWKERVRWDAWRKAHPDTLVLLDPNRPTEEE